MQSIIIKSIDFKPVGIHAANIKGTPLASSKRRIKRRPENVQSPVLKRRDERFTKIKRLFSKLRRHYYQINTYAMYDFSNLHYDYISGWGVRCHILFRPLVCVCIDIIRNKSLKVNQEIDLDK